MRKKIISSLIIIFISFSLNYKSFCNSTKPELIAESAILMDSASNKVIFSKNSENKMYPASTTKILTAILAIENCNLDDKVTVTYDAISSIPSGYSVASLQVGEILSVKDLLKVLLVHSANDAANVLAFHVSGSIENFSDLMNNKISELGLKNTHFINPSGKHDEKHYTTAHDLALIMQYCMKDSTFRSLMSLKSCTIAPTNKYDERVFSTTNEMLILDNRDVESNYYYKYIIAGKTGYTTEARNCLVSVSNKDGFELISVVLGVGLYPNNLSGKFLDTKALFSYGYDNYTIKKLNEKNSIVKQIIINNGTKETKNLDLLSSIDITALVKKEDINSEFPFEIQLDENLSAPISQNQVVGKLVYNIDGVDYSSDLLASHNVEKNTYFYLIIQIVLLLMILFVLYKLIFTEKNKDKNIYRIKYF